MVHLTVTEKKALLEYGYALIEDEINLQRNPTLAMPGWWAKRKLRKAAKIFGYILEHDTANWSAMWALGKIYQRFREHYEALCWFQQAFELQPSNPDICREAGLSAMELGDTHRAVRFCEAASEADPADSGLVANLALAYLIAQRLDDSLKTVTRAIHQTPDDPITQSILVIISYMHAGMLSAPHSMPELLEKTKEMHKRGILREGKND